MFAWVADNLASIGVGALVLALITLALVKVIRDKKNGRGCAGCPYASSCAAHQCGKTPPSKSEQLPPE